MSSITSTKPGFLLVAPKDNSAPTVEIFSPGRYCSILKKGEISLVLLGEVLNENGILTSAEILERYERREPSWASPFDGAFVLIILNAAAGPPVIITDPLNALKCFFEETPESYLFVSSLAFLPTRPRNLDPIAVTSFLTNGVVYNGRTIFEGVRVLPRAGTHTINPATGVTSSVYWKFGFDQAFAGRGRSELRDELAALLINAAEKRLRSPATFYLSLSGGYDSTCILGLLKRIRPPRVECFSYVTQAESGSDEFVAAQMARTAGFPHRKFLSFNGDAPTLMQLNGAWGECRSHFCGETNAWQALHQVMAPDGVILAGDECFGWFDYRFRSEDDLVASIPMQKSSVLETYGNYIDLTALGNGFDHEIDQLFARCQDKDWHDRKDSVYLDQRLTNVILPWRENFAGRTCPVRNILLDRNILDFVSHLPSSFRRGKNLYKETVHRMFPELFKVERTYRPSVDYLRTALHNSRDTLALQFEEERSLVDPWLQLDQCAALCRSIEPTRPWSMKQRLVMQAKRFLKENRLATVIKGNFPPERVVHVSPTVLIMRILTLRSYLRTL